MGNTPPAVNMVDFVRPEGDPYYSGRIEGRTDADWGAA